MPVWRLRYVGGAFNGGSGVWCGVPAGDARHRGIVATARRLKLGGWEEGDWGPLARGMAQENREAGVFHCTAF